MRRIIAVTVIMLLASCAGDVDTPPDAGACVDASDAICEIGVEVDGPPVCDQYYCGWSCRSGRCFTAHICCIRGTCAPFPQRR